MGQREGAGEKVFIFKCSMASFCYMNLAQTDVLKLREHTASLNSTGYLSTLQTLWETRPHNFSFPKLKTATVSLQDLFVMGGYSTWINRILHCR